MGAMCGLPWFWTEKYPKSIYMKRPAVLDQRRHPKPFSLRWAQPWGPAGRDLSVAVRSRCPGVQRGMVGWTQLGFQVGIKFINLYINVFVFWDYPCHFPSDLYDSDLIPDKAAEACYNMRQHVTPFTQNRPSSSRPPRSGPTPSAALAGGAIPSRWLSSYVIAGFAVYLKRNACFVYI